MGTTRADHQDPVNVRHLGEGRTAGERIADGVAARVGAFILVQSTLLALWIMGNAFLLHDWPNGRPFDPYPFILLNLMLSFQAAYTGPFVVMSQNRQVALDRDEAEHHYAVNREGLDILRRLEAEQTRVKSLLEQSKH